MFKKDEHMFFLVVLAINFNYLCANREELLEDVSVQFVQTFVQPTDSTWLVSRYGSLFSKGDDSCIKGLKICTEFGCEKCRNGERVNGCLIIACGFCLIPTVTAARCIASTIKAVVPKIME